MSEIQPKSLIEYMAMSRGEILDEVERMRESLPIIQALAFKLGVCDAALESILRDVERVRDAHQDHDGYPD